MKLKDEYLNRSEKVLCSSEARRYAYKHLIKLVKLGALTRIGVKGSHKMVYKKTASFNDVVFIPELEEQKKDIVVFDKEKLKSSAIEKLEEALQQYNADMMAAIGESEEYIRLIGSVPEMGDSLTEKYYLARDKSAKLLGKIQAVETVIATYGEV
jgi:hypothetical protein